jgi:hypothetical protein
MTIFVGKHASQVPYKLEVIFFIRFIKKTIETSLNRLVLVRFVFKKTGSNQFGSIFFR